jgi:indolepyruvate ferredoxin oxidoreductase
MSRYSGVWAGMKTIQEIVESSATAMIDPERVQIACPTDFQMPPGGVHIRWPDHALEQEARLFDYKWYAALAYIRANRLNYNVIEGPNDRFGIIASGKAYNDTRQALLDLGLDDATCRRLGIRLHKVGVVWPLEAQGTREFAPGPARDPGGRGKAPGHRVPAEGRALQLAARRAPNVLGKFDEVEGDYSGGEWSMPNPTAHTLLRANADLSPALIARAIARRLKKLGLDADVQARIDAQLAILEAKERSMQVVEVKGDRQPWFCSGCPHNTSTVVPEGSRAMAGIGCHFMATWMDRATIGFTQMGGEGVPWVGQQPFTNEKHVFANLGDGTYFHSGSAGDPPVHRRRRQHHLQDPLQRRRRHDRRPAGGRAARGPLGAADRAQPRAEGVKKMVVVTDEPEKYDGAKLPPASRCSTATSSIASSASSARSRAPPSSSTTRPAPPRSAAAASAAHGRPGRARGDQRPGVRRLRRLQRQEQLPVGGAAGDRVRPQAHHQPEHLQQGHQLPQGLLPQLRHRRRRQAQGQGEAKEGGPSPYDGWANCPSRSCRAPHGAYGIVVAGVGGTGVITIGQLLGMAAHIEGKGIVTQDAAGLAQKGGATWSHVLIADAPGRIRTTRVSMAAADLIIGCDPIVAAGKETVLRMREGRTRVALNAHSTPTAAFVKNGNWANPADACAAEIGKAVGPAGLAAFDADAAATRLMGDSIYTNPMMLGYAWQKGWVPLARESLLRAIELNAVAVDNNKAAFEWGRRAAHDRRGAEAAGARRRSSSSRSARRWTAWSPAGSSSSPPTRTPPMPSATATSSSACGPPRRRWARRADRGGGRYLFKLMAYKDEYEVARLHAETGFREKVAASSRATSRSTTTWRRR